MTRLRRCRGVVRRAEMRHIVVMFRGGSGAPRRTAAAGRGRVVFLVHGTHDAHARLVPTGHGRRVAVGVVVAQREGRRRERGHTLGEVWSEPLQLFGRVRVEGHWVVWKGSGNVY